MGQPSFRLQMLTCSCPAKRKILALDTVVGNEAVESMTVTFACCGSYDAVPHSVAKPSRWVISKKAVQEMLEFMGKRETT